jgi:hypothetical protein
MRPGATLSCNSKILNRSLGLRVAIEQGFQAGNAFFTSFAAFLLFELAPFCGNKFSG